MGEKLCPRVGANKGNWFLDIAKPGTDLNAPLLHIGYDLI